MDSTAQQAKQRQEACGLRTMMDEWIGQDRTGQDRTKPGRADAGGRGTGGLVGWGFLF